MSSVNNYVDLHKYFKIFFLRYKIAETSQRSSLRSSLSPRVSSPRRTPKSPSQPLSPRRLSSPKSPPRLLERSVVIDKVEVCLDLIVNI